MATARSTGGEVRMHLNQLTEDRYERKRVIARGEETELRLFHDRQTGRDVVMKSGLAGASPGTEARVLREASIQAQLDHPGVIPVYDLGRSPSGQACFVMKQIPGRTLAVGNKSGVPLVEKLRALVQACNAVDYAHSRGVVHRNLSPDHILLGNNGQAYVLDWSGALSRGPEEVPLPLRDVVYRADRAIRSVGTPGYRAPELRAAPHDVDGRADVYSLGAVLFEIVSGQPMGEDPSAVFESAAVGRDSDLAYAQIRVPAPLRQLCERATASRRRERMRTAVVLEDGIRDWLQKHESDRLASGDYTSGVVDVGTGGIGGPTAFSTPPLERRPRGDVPIPSTRKRRVGPLPGPVRCDPRESAQGTGLRSRKRSAPAAS